MENNANNIVQQVSKVNVSTITGIVSDLHAFLYSARCIIYGQLTDDLDNLAYWTHAAERGSPLLNDFVRCATKWVGRIGIHSNSPQINKFTYIF